MIKGEVEYDVVDLIWTGQLIIHLINFNVFLYIILDEIKRHKKLTCDLNVSEREKRKLKIDF